MFDNSASAGFYNPNKTGGGTPSKPKKQTVLQNVVPVCIRQILNTTDDEFVLFGLKAHLVTIVGILRDYDVTSTKATYTIEDHTGTIKAVMWLSSDSVEGLRMPNVREGRYLKVRASIRVTDNEKSLLAHNMRPVDNQSVITNHLLSVIRTRYAIEQLQSEGNVSKMQHNPSAALANSMHQFFSDNVEASNTGFTPIQLKTHNIFKSDNSMNGMHISSLLANFQKNQHAEVQKAIDFLQSEGHIYTTIDTNHFKSTD